MSLSNNQMMIVGFLNQAISNEALSHDDLMKKIGVHNIARQFPRECWQALQEVMHGVNIAPAYEEETDWVDAPEDDSEAMDFLVETIISAMDDESEEPVITSSSLWNIIGPEELVMAFQNKVWESLSDALNGDVPADDEPEVIEDDEGSDEEKPQTSSTPTMPGGPPIDGNGSEG